MVTVLEVCFNFFFVLAVAPTASSVLVLVEVAATITFFVFFVFLFFFFRLLIFLGVEFGVVQFSVAENEEMRHPFTFHFIFQVQNAVLLQNHII